MDLFGENNNFLNNNNNNVSLKKILVLYTGGTIGMQKNDKGVYIPVPNAFINKIKSYMEMHDEKYVRQLLGDVPNNVMVIPNVDDKNGILYTIKEYDPLLDSSNMSIKDWARIAGDIEHNYNDYDGFVVLHGTDTLSYTASALSFMLEGLKKTVTVTGSQIPIFESRSDAKDNFIASLVFTALYNIPEVCVCFANKLFRGNRTVKSSSNLLEAFTSPNYHLLGKVGINYKVHSQYLFKPDNKIPFTIHTNFNTNVGILALFPMVSVDIVKSYLSPPIKGVVLRSYGIGNIPLNIDGLLDVLSEAVTRDIIIVNVTQCNQGTVSSTYETGKALEEIGIIAGNDMTTEAALAKLAFVLGHENMSLSQKKEMMRSNIRGELTLQ